MGVGGGFWEFLKPIARSESLENLKGKRVAIDLSFWIVQQETALKGNARKPHLRLTFFRAVKLISKLGIFPVFIVDGEAPMLKTATRLNRYYRMISMPTKIIDGSVNRNVVFNCMIEESVELLKLMGMPVLRAEGEAEALCAQLNRDGLVDACITTDSDVFLHGANCVIKSFQPDFKEPVVECYLASDINQHLGLKRNHLIAIALLAGCDYNTDGVPGIGINTAVRIVRLFNEDQIFDKLQELGKGNSEVLPDIDKCEAHDIEFGNASPIKRKSHCSFCGHSGNKANHLKFGCESCRKLYNNENCVKKDENFKCFCESCKMYQKRKEDYKYLSWKTKIIDKITAVERFPNEEIIDIFLRQDICSVSETSANSISWEIPKLEPLEEFLGQKLYWAPTYTRQKIFPFCSALFLRDMANGRKEGLTESRAKLILWGRYIPHSIERTKVHYFQTFYVLKWKPVIPEYMVEDWFGIRSGQEIRKDSEVSTNEYVKDASAIELTAIDGDAFITTDEDMGLVESACPKLVETYLHEMENRRQKRTASGRKRKESSSSARQLSITSYFKSSKERALPNWTKPLHTSGCTSDRMKSNSFVETKHGVKHSVVSRTNERENKTKMLLQSKAYGQSSSSNDDDSVQKLESSSVTNHNHIGSKVRRCLFQ